MKLMIESFGTEKLEAGLVEANESIAIEVWFLPDRISSGSAGGYSINCDGPDARALFDGHKLNIPSSGGYISGPFCMYLAPTWIDRLEGRSRPSLLESASERRRLLVNFSDAVKTLNRNLPSSLFLVTQAGKGTPLVPLGESCAKNLT